MRMQRGAENNWKRFFLCVMMAHSILLTSTDDAAAQSLKLNSPLVDGGNVLAFRITGDNTHVIYRADQDINETIDLYSVPLSGHTTPMQTQCHSRRRRAGPRVSDYS